MSPAKMRFVLALSLLLGAATTINVLGDADTATGSANVMTEPVTRTPSGAGDPAQAAPNSPATAHLAAVRRELMTRGYLSDPGAGPLDVRTRAAILAFEYDYGLTLTATPGEALLKSLIFDVSPPEPKTGDRAMTPAAIALIEQVQRALSRLGYAKSGVTGRIDGATRSAIRALERARGLEGTGRISANLVDSLGPALAAP